MRRGIARFTFPAQASSLLHWSKTTRAASAILITGWALARAIIFAAPFLLWALGHLPKNCAKELAVVAPSQMYAVADARCFLGPSFPGMAGEIKMTAYTM